MAFRASLELNNKEFDVLYSNYEFSRNTDPKGMPSSSVLGGRVEKSEYAVTANDLKNKSDIPILLFLACTGYQ